MPLYGQQAAALANFQVAWSSIVDMSAVNSTAEISLMTGTAQGTRTLPANWLQPGRTCRIILNGFYNAPSLPGTLTIRAKLGGVTIATAVVNTLLSLAAGKGAQITTTFTCKSSGSAAKLGTAGTFQFGIAGQGRSFYDIMAVADVQIDGTVAQQIDVTAQWSGADTNANLTIKTGTVELLTQ